MEGENRWGVYAKHNGEGLEPSDSVRLGTAQVTVVISAGVQIQDMVNVDGYWDSNAIVPSPIENPNSDYWSFGYIADSIEFSLDGLHKLKENLLFTFSTDVNCPDVLNLIEIDDPFDVLPNSVNNNPGNNYDAVDIGLS